jgi:hypothetical protein
VVFDIYDSEKMTEPSNAGARRIYPAMELFQVVQADALPLPNRNKDAAFLPFAAQKVRAEVA